ncbi:LysR substrate binding domain protein [compost metagenome]
MAIQLAAMNCGIALADPMATLAQRHLDIAVRRFRPAVKLHYGLVFPKGKRRSPATEQLVDELRQVAKAKIADLKRLLDGPPQDET